MGATAKPRRYRRYAFGKAEENGWKCHYCGKPIDPLTITGDHVKPQSKGGQDKWSNIVPACERCNSTKSDLSIDAWLARKGHNRGARQARKHPPISVWNERTGEWVPIGAQGRRYIPMLMETGKYAFK